MQQTPDPAHVQQMVSMFFPMMMLVGLLGSALIVIPFWVIFRKAGLGAPLSLLMLVPGVGIVMLYVLAFSRWKVIPAPEYAAGYPSAYPNTYPATTAYPPDTAAPPAYVPPTDPSSRF